MSKKRWYKVLITDENWFIIIKGIKEKTGDEYIDVIREVEEGFEYYGRDGVLRPFKCEPPLDYYINNENNCAIYTKKGGE